MKQETEILSDKFKNLEQVAMQMQAKYINAKKSNII